MRPALPDNPWHVRMTNVTQGRKTLEKINSLLLLALDAFDLFDASFQGIRQFWLAHQLVLESTCNAML